MDPRKETACRFLPAAVGRNECKCANACIHVCSVSSIGVAPVRDTVAVSSNLVSSAIWD